MGDRQRSPISMDRDRYRWLMMSLLLGSVLAMLLVANSVVNYVFVSRRIVVDEVRREMGPQVAAFELKLRTRGLAVAVDDLEKNRRFEWMRLTGPKRTLVAHTGPDESSFTDSEIRAGLSKRDSVFKVRQTATGPVVVQVFPVHGPGFFGLLEVAMSTNAVSQVFWPLRRNLIIDCSAALALLIAMLVIRIRFRAYVQGRELEHQLELARGVQQDLLPDSNRTLPYVRMAAECIPALGVGGDFYDAFPAGNGVALVLGDVAGKGMPAALLMGVIHGGVRSADWTGSDWLHEQSTERLNQLLCERTAGARYATMFWAYFDPKAGELRYINGGHCPPLLVRHREGRTAIRKLEEGGPVLGLLPNARYRATSEPVEPRDVLIAYSDGVVEAANSPGEQFGEERLMQALENCAGQEPDAIRDHILKAVRDFAGPGAMDDDLTLMIVECGDFTVLNTLDDNHRAHTELKKEGALSLL